MLRYKIIVTYDGIVESHYHPDYNTEIELRNALNVYWKKYQNKEFKTYKTSFVKDLFRFKK